MSTQQHLLVRLHREWKVLSHRPAVLRRASGWGLDLPFTSLDDIVVAAGLYHRREAREAAGRTAAGTSPEGNTVLARLLVLARSDDLAARVVLQRLLPGLVSRARRWRPTRRGGSETAFEELVTAAWLVIRGFPVERRPTHLAANLLRDAEYQAFVRATRRVGEAESVPPSMLDLPVSVERAVEPAVELAELVADAHRVLSARDVQLVRLLVSGRSPVEVAAAMDVSVRTVGYHRDAVVRRLRQAARETAAA